MSERDTGLKMLTRVNILVTAEADFSYAYKS